jgi:hypothetical protein
LNSGDALLLEPYHHPILLWSCFEDVGLVNYFSRMTLNLNPPDLSLPSS